MADGGLAMEENRKVEWAENKGLNAKELQLERLLSMKLTSPLVNDSNERRSSSSSSKVKKILDDRDEMWREHERSQYALMEREHDRLLHVLHQEIEHLQRKCGDVTLELANALTVTDQFTGTEVKSTTQHAVVRTKSTIADLQGELDEARNELVNLRQSTEKKNEKIESIERRCADQENRFREDLDRRSKKIKDMSAELNQKAAVITQVMTQLHQLRLREAVEKQKRQLGDQQARRRQMLLTTSVTKMPSHAWLQNETPTSDSMLLFGIQAQQFRRPGGMRSLTTPAAAAAGVRSSILPPIFATPLTRTTSSLVNNNNIEKPVSAAQFAKSFRSSSFRRASFNQGHDQEQKQ